MKSSRIALNVLLALALAATLAGPAGASVQVMAGCSASAAADGTGTGNMSWTGVAVGCIRSSQGARICGSLYDITGGSRLVSGPHCRTFTGSSGSLPSYSTPCTRGRVYEARVTVYDVATGYIDSSDSDRGTC